ncbi:hypothetical protein MTR67_012739 [Solanum verrucosum]|uniref:Uncharacterized protein n=1 Tax=Solanum verrucosum TaxID=315347 RepID=A0AAF0QG81_SOLVR|nr:hypothetical protein MTR67_012739 [Solanum verrucosum]
MLEPWTTLVTPHLVGLGPAQPQPPPRPVMALKLQEAITQLLTILGGMQKASSPIAPVLACYKKQKILKEFLRLTPLRLSREIGDDAHEFQMTCPERIYTLGIVESKGDNFTTYQLHRPARLDGAVTRGLSTRADIVGPILDSWIHIVDLTSGYSKVSLADLFRWYFTLQRETDDLHRVAISLGSLIISPGTILSEE